MLDSQASTIPESELSLTEADLAPQSLELSDLPPIYILPTHLKVSELDNLVCELTLAGARIAPSITDASIVVGAIASAKRARFELQTRNVEIRDIMTLKQVPEVGGKVQIADSDEQALGKRKRDGTLGGHVLDSSATRNDDAGDSLKHEPAVMRMVKLDWLRDTLAKRAILPLTDYLICIFTTTNSSIPKSGDARNNGTPPVVETDGPSSPVPDNEVQSDPFKDLRTSTQGGRRARQRRRRTSPATNPGLVRETTEEYEAISHRVLPEMPEWVRAEQVYACQRPTPADSLNEDFLELLKKIRVTRILIEDEIGVRAYSTSIASIAAYPYKLSDPHEITLLPGCDQKIAQLFREYQTTGRIATAEVLETDAALKVIHHFYGIWGVGAKTAREFYYDRGWRDHDDIVEYGWNALTRVQQIGLKYFDEFELKIPRAEVERIAAAVAAEARALTDDRLTCTVVGGYRRGKTESGDVDLVLSHPDEDVTAYLVHRLVARLEDAEMISHTLTLSEANSARGQQPVGLKMAGARHAGFDTLDKALVVWQEPEWPGKAADRLADADARNPNVHRRLDIIISPWRTVGCAIAGWSSGTTFQRDLRRWSRRKLRWKFDSSGVRDLATGRWIDLERWSDVDDRAQSPEEAERRVFEGMGLPYLEPRDRCTG